MGRRFQIRLYFSTGHPSVLDFPSLSFAALDEGIGDCLQIPVFRIVRCGAPPEAFCDEIGVVSFGGLESI